MVNERTASSSKSMDRRERFHRFFTSQVLGPLITLVLIFGALLVLLTFVFERFRISKAYRPENTLPVLLLVGVVALMCAIAVTTIVFGRLELTNWREPLGLPAGSVRAIIALMLIVMFFITALFLYADLGTTQPDRTLRGMSQAFLDSLPKEDLIGATPIPAATPGGPVTFDIVLAGAGRNAAAVDVAKQLVTTVSTLVVAVAAFYFGASTVQNTTQSRNSGGSNARERPNGGSGIGDVVTPDAPKSNKPVRGDAI